MHHVAGQSFSKLLPTAINTGAALEPAAARACRRVRGSIKFSRSLAAEKFARMNRTSSRRQKTALRTLIR